MASGGFVSLLGLRESLSGKLPIRWSSPSPTSLKPTASMQAWLRRATAS